MSFFLQFAGRAEGTRGAHVQTNRIQRTMADVTPFQSDSCRFLKIALDIFQTVTAITYKVAKVVYGNESDNHRNWSDTVTAITYKVAKVVYGNQSDNHRNWSDTVVHTTTTAPLANTEFPSLSSTHTHTHTHTRNTHTYAHMGKLPMGINKPSPTVFLPQTIQKHHNIFTFPPSHWMEICMCVTLLGKYTDHASS